MTPRGATVGWPIGPVGIASATGESGPVMAVPTISTGLIGLVVMTPPLTAFIVFPSTIEATGRSAILILDMMATPP